MAKDVYCSFIVKKVSKPNSPCLMLSYLFVKLALINILKCANHKPHMASTKKSCKGIWKINEGGRCALIMAVLYYNCYNYVKHLCYTTGRETVSREMIYWSTQTSLNVDRACFKPLLWKLPHVKLSDPTEEPLCLYCLYCSESRDSACMACLWVERVFLCSQRYQYVDTFLARW